MRLLPLLFLFLTIPPLFSQAYDVVDYQKIGHLQGGWDVALDSEDWLGYAVEFIGDINGDSINDIALAALKDDDGGFNRGAVYILFMEIGGTVGSYQKISDSEGGFEAALEDWDIFGSSIAYLGDLNEDGRTEIAVGAEYDGDGGWWHGAIYILSLNPDGTVYDYIKISDTEGNFEAALGDEDVFGTDIAFLGDLNGDGMGDIAVSARRDPDGGSDRGAVYILFLAPDFTVASYQKISDAQGGIQGALNSGDYFGGSVTNIGDLNEDGIIDLAVGSYRDDDGGDNHGAVYILFMNTDGTVSEYQKISDLEGNFEASFNQGMFFGISSDLSSDTNEDGLPELLVGASGYLDGEGIEKGAFYILNLNTDGTVNSYIQYTEGLQEFEGELSDGNGFGFSVSYEALYADGNKGIAVGAYLDEEFGDQFGSMWILTLGEVLAIENEDPLDPLYIFPNPTGNLLHFSDNSVVASVEVYNMQGKRVMLSSAQPSNNYYFGLLQGGMYLLKVLKDNGTAATFRLIIN